MQGLITVFDNLTAILNSGVGRDKSCRVLQYALMALIPILQAKGAHMTRTVERMNKFKASMSQTRKVLRFGKEIPLLTGIKARLDQPSQSMLVWRTLNDMALMMYFFTDHPLFFHNVGFYTFSQSTLTSIDYINNVFWLLNALFDIVVSWTDLKAAKAKLVLLREKVKQGSQDEMTQLRAEVKQQRQVVAKILLNIIRNTCDIPVIFFFMKHGGSQTVSGLLGTCSSLISLYSLYGQK